MNILIVEDERGLSREVDNFLTKEGYICDVSFTGKDASEKIYVNQYDFVLLDLGLPDYEGLDLLREAKNAKNEASFIILTARGDIEDKVKGLDMGADDYLPKPFSLLELSSRINAIIRRKHAAGNTIIPIHGFELDIQNRAVSYNQQKINLTKKEFDILHYLVLHKNRVLTRLQLTEHVWGDILEDDTESNYIDVHLKNLRKKLAQHAPADWIETVRGMGYKVSM